MSRIPPLTPAYAEASPFAEASEDKSTGRPALPSLLTGHARAEERGLIENKGRGYSGKVGCRFT